MSLGFLRYLGTMIRTPMLCLLLTLTAVSTLPAQEFNARVTLNRTQITNTSLDYLDELVPLLQQYINQHTWTDFTFQEHERLNVNIQVVLNTESNNVFEASLIISAERPIYNTLLVTPLVVISDPTWRFSYTRSQSLTRDLQQFHDIASVVDFYMYLLLAIDADTFSELGGTPHYRTAQGVVDVAAATGGLSWQPGAGTRRNRYHLINGLSGPSSDPLRRALYTYHRQGLDLFTRDPDQARRNILQALTLIRDARRVTTDTYVFDLFFDTKYRELAAVFLDADPAVRLEAYNLLVEVDQSHISEYDKLQ